MLRTMFSVKASRAVNCPSGEVVGTLLNVDNIRRGALG